jgi:hypothetical protein
MILVISETAVRLIMSSPLLSSRKHSSTSLLESGTVAPLTDAQCKVKTLYIERGSPWESAYSETFIGSAGVEARALIAAPQDLSTHDQLLCLVENRKYLSLLLARQSCFVPSGIMAPSSTTYCVFNVSLVAPWAPLKSA